MQELLDDEDDFMEQLKDHTRQQKTNEYTFEGSPDNSTEVVNNNNGNRNERKTEDSIVQKVYGQHIFNQSTATATDSSSVSDSLCHDFRPSKPSKRCKFGDKCFEREKLLCSYYHGNDPLLATQFCYCMDGNCILPHPKRAKATRKNRADTDQKKLICKSCGGSHTIHFCPHMKCNECNRWGHMAPVCKIVHERERQEYNRDRYESDNRYDRYEYDKYGRDRYGRDRYERDRYERDRYERDRYEREMERYDRDRYEHYNYPNDYGSHFRY